jgi:ABC transporter substrate binding protein
MSSHASRYKPLTWIGMKAVRAIRFAVVFAVTVTVVPSTALSSGLVVLYPEVRKPYTKIYEDIIAGIDEANHSDTNTIAITPDNSMDYYRNNVTRFEPDAIIALGKNSLSLFHEMNLDIPLVAGAITRSEDDITGISMVPDTRVIIDKLLLLYGGVRNIHLVTNPRNRVDQIKIATDYAASKSVHLIVHEVTTIQAAAGEYKELLSNIEKHDAIWLMRDKAINDSSLLSQVLETAWKKRVAVFSTNPTHVKRGALFAIYPNNKKLGKSLARLADKQRVEKIAPSSLIPLQDVYTVVNGRTSRHLGISVAGDVRAEIDSIF